MGVETVSQWYSICQREDLTSDAQNPWKVRCRKSDTCDPSAFTARAEWMQGNPWTLMYQEQHELCFQLGKEPGPTPKAVLWPPHSDVVTILTLMYTAVNNTQLSPSRWRARTHTKAVLWPPQRWCLISYPPIFTQTQTSFAHTHKHTKNRTTKFIDYTFSTTKYWPYLKLV